VPLQTDYPTGLGSQDEWGLEGAASKILAVATNDGDASIVYADSGGATRVQRFTFPAIGGVADPVNDSDLYCRVREYAVGAGGRSFHFQWNSVLAGSNLGETGIHATRPNYSLQTYSAGAALLAAVNGEHGFQMSAAGGPSQKWEVWVTQFYRTVDYTYTASTSADQFAHLIGSLAAAIGANLLLRDMAALVRSIQRRTGVLIKASEYAEALAAWRRERHVRLA
jgi:hypothetical protein